MIFVVTCNQNSQGVIRQLLRPLLLAAMMTTFCFGQKSGSDSSVVSTTSIAKQQNSLRQSIDPRHDGWHTEVLNEEATKQLKLLVKLLTSGREINPNLLSGLAIENISCDPLRPKILEEVFRDSALIVFRPPRRTTESTAAKKGWSGFANMLNALTQPLEPDSTRRAKLGIFRIQITDDTAQTSAYFQMSGQTTAGQWQANAIWHCDWQLATGNAPPRLTSITVQDYEEIIAVGSRKPLFSDCTTSILQHNSSFHDQLAYGINHWVKRIEMINGISIYSRYGMAVGDVNGDGLDDIYVCQPGGLPNRLYAQNSDGTATDISTSAGVNWLDQTSSALLIDLDNDGDQDLVAATLLGLLVMSNDSTGHFNLRATLTTSSIQSQTMMDIQSLSAVDYDGDGDLDLYICVDFLLSDHQDGETVVPFLYHDANNGGANALFRNDIDRSDTEEWHFTNVTPHVGLDVDNRRHSLAASWEDYDKDGDQDLYVANDYGQNCLYRNDNGHFVNVADQSGVVDFGSGMSASWGDYNRDGWMDLYVGNMFSSAGRRITQQSNFQPDQSDLTRSIYSRFAKGNSLFSNNGNNTFVEVGAEAGVEMGRWAWSSLFMDINNDGWEDLVVANGYLTTDDTGDL